MAPKYHYFFGDLLADAGRFRVRAGRFSPKGRVFLRQNSSSGFVFLMLALSVGVLLAMLGLAIDFGRVYVVKDELQAYADTAALAASYELDGTPFGIERARQRAQQGPGGGSPPNKWNFGTQTVSDVQCRFATTPEGPFIDSPALILPLNYRFVQVVASAPLSLSFLPVVRGITADFPVTASAVAGQSSQSVLGTGIDPFSPDVVNPINIDYGFVKGGGLQYTIHWAPPGQRALPGGACNGDLLNSNLTGTSDRGYINIGQGNSQDGLNATVVNNEFFLPSPIAVGSSIQFMQGNRNVGDAIGIRFNEDTDTTSLTYATYELNLDVSGDRIGNGRRILTVPVNNNGVVVGFAAFFMPSNMGCLSDKNKPCCAEYLGPAVLHGGRVGVSPIPGVYAIKLFH